MNFFKRIWNYFFGKKKVKDYGCQPITIPPHESCDEPIIKSKWIEQKIEQPKPHTQLFRKHQLQGKVYRLGKSRFRIKKKIGQAGEKLKYHIELI